MDVIQISDRIKRMAASQTLAMSQKSSELRASGVDVINLSVGEPDFNTPLHIKEAECLSQLEGLYPPDTTPAPDPVEEKALEIDDNVQRLLNQAMQDATAEHLRSKAAQEEQDLSDTAEFTPGLPR